MKIIRFFYSALICLLLLFATSNVKAQQTFPFSEPLQFFGAACCGGGASLSQTPITISGVPVITATTVTISGTWEADNGGSTEITTLLGEDASTVIGNLGNASTPGSTLNSCVSNFNFNIVPFTATISVADYNVWAADGTLTLYVAATPPPSAINVVNIVTAACPSTIDGVLTVVTSFEIPTLSQWGLIMFSLMLLTLAAIGFRKREKAIAAG